MAKMIIFVEQYALNSIMNMKEGETGLKWETDKAIYYALNSEFHKEWIKDMRDNLITHEKKKLTRKETIEIFQKHMPIVQNPERTIDFYIEAGMLEIVEEENIGLPIGFSFPFTKRQEWTDFVTSLNHQGFIIVKKP